MFNLKIISTMELLYAITSAERSLHSFYPLFYHLSY